jgi:hypothetical protein
MLFVISIISDGHGVFSNVSQTTGRRQSQGRQKGCANHTIGIVFAQHLVRHRLAETPTARNATETTLREKCAVDNGDKFRLVNIFTVPYPLESSIADIDICSHDILDFGAKVERILELIYTYKKR